MKDSKSFKPVLKAEQSLLARERRTILQWNPVENKINNFGDIFPLYPNFVYHSLSLSQFEERQKSEKTFIFVDCPIICFWHFERVHNCSKGFYVFSCYHVVYVVTSCFLFSFYSPYVILLRIVLLIPKVSHGKPELPTTTILILLRLKPVGPYSSVV